MDRFESQAPIVNSARVRRAITDCVNVLIGRLTEFIDYFAVIDLESLSFCELRVRYHDDADNDQVRGTRMIFVCYDGFYATPAFKSGEPGR